MKTISITILISLISFVNYSQSLQNKPVNQTLIRLTIIKDNDKMLIRETEYGWMTPAVYFKERQNIHQILDSISTKYGIEISNINLNGLFTYKYDFKSTADLRQLYTASYKSGNLKPLVGKEKIFWMPIEEALEKLGSTVESLKEITNQIIKYPKIVWGGSFILYKTNGKLNSKMEEKFYPLTNIN